MSGITSIVQAGTGATIDLGANTLSLANNTTVTNFLKSLTINNPINNGGFQLLVSSAGLMTGSTTTLNGVISGTGSLNVQTLGTLMLGNAANTYTGPTTLAAGTTNVASLADGGVASSIGASGNAAANLIFSGGTLQYTGATAQTTNRLFSVTGGTSSTIAASGSVPTATVSFTNSAAMTGPNGSAATLVLGGTNTGANTMAPLLANGTANLNVTQLGGGTWHLTNTGSTYTGKTTISGGILNVASLADGGVASSIGAASSLYTNLVFEGGTLQYTGTIAQSTDRNFTLNGTGGTIDASGTGAGTLNLVGLPMPLHGTFPTLTLTGTNTGPNLITRQLSNPPGPFASVIKNGTGVWQLPGPKDYTGTTTINSGVFVVGQIDGSRFNVAGGTLGGNGSVRNIVATGGVVSPSLEGLGSVGTLSVGGTGGSTFNGATFSPSISGVAADLLTQTSSSLNLAGGILKVNTLAAGAIGTIYTVISTTGVLSGVFSNVPFSGTTALFGSDFYRVTYDYASGFVTLTKVAPITSLHWTGSVSSNWSDPRNWLEMAAPFDGVELVFDTTTAGFAGSAAAFAPNNDITGLDNVSLTINDASAAGDFAIGGVGFSLTGGSAISNSVTVGTDATINLGVNTLSLGAASTISSATAAPLIISNEIANGGFLLQVDGAGNTTLNGEMSGTGGLIKNGAGTLTLGNTASTYTGVTTVNSGILNVAALANGNFVSSIGATNNLAGNLVLNGGTLQYTGTSPQNTNRLFTVGVNGGTIDSSGTGSLTFNGVGSVLGPGAGGGTLTLTGTNTSSSLGLTLANGAGVLNVVKSGTGTWIVGGSNTYTGTTTINGGILDVSSLGNGGVASGLGASSSAAANLVFNGGTLRYSGSSLQSTDRLFTLNGNGTISSDGTASIVFVNSGALVVPGAGVTLTLRGSNGGNNIFTPLLDDGTTASNLLKDDSGTWTLARSYTYDGTTTINAGTLVEGITNALPTTTALTNNGVLDLSGHNQQVASITGTGTVLSNFPGSTFTVNNAAAVAFGGTFTSANLSLVKMGTGTLTLSGASSYGGTTTINGGTLAVGVANALPIGTTLNIGSTSTLDLNGFNQEVAILEGAGIATDSGAAATLTVNNLVANTFPGTFTSTNLGLRKIGVGVLTLLGNSGAGFTGPTTVQAGTLEVNGTNSGSPVSVSGGVLTGTGMVRSVNTTSGSVAPAGTTTLTTATGAIASRLIGATFVTNLVGPAAAGRLTLGDGATIDLSGGALNIASVTGSMLGNTYILVTSNTGGISGAFTDLPNNALIRVADKFFVIRYTPNAVTLTEVNPNSGGGSTPGGSDTTAPTVSISPPSAASTSRGPITYTITYADANFNGSTLLASNVMLNRTGTAFGIVTVSPGSGATRTVTISNITGNGTLGISLAPGTASDRSGNLAPAAGPSVTFVVSDQPAFAVGGSDGVVRLLTNAGTAISSVTPIAGYTGLVSVALGNFNGDAVADLAVAAANPAGVAGLTTDTAGKVFVYDGAAFAKGMLSLIRAFTPFASSSSSSGAYTNGLNIAVGDINGDGTADLVAGSRGGNGSTSGQIEAGRLVVIDGKSPAGANTVIGGIQTPFSAGYQKGVIVAVGNVDGVGGDEIGVTRGGPVANPNPAVQTIKVKVLQFKDTGLSELPLNADGSTAFAPFAGLTGAAKGISRDGRVTFVDSDGDGKAELVFTAFDPLTSTTNKQVRVGVYAIDTAASKAAATIVSTGPDQGTYVTGNAVVDHATTGTKQSLALLTESAASGLVYLASRTGAVQTGGFSLNIVTGGITIDGV